MLVAIINYATLFAFAFLSYGIFLQIKRIVKRKSSADISLGEVSLRFGVGFVILAKNFLVGDPWLIFGQLFFLGTSLVYFIITIKYHRA